MDTTQVYDIVNSLAQQSMGESALTVTDVQGLISLGNVVLSSTTNTEAYLNTLVQRIGKTQISFRPYTSKLSDMVFDDMEWGGIVQKVKYEAPDAVEDPSPELEDGQSVDHYKVYKGKVNQKLFVTRAPYMFPITTPEAWIEEAFTGPSKMASFMNAIQGEVSNKAELSVENLGRATLANLIAELAGTNREVHLITLFTAAGGETVTAENALTNGDFLRFAVSTIKTYMDMFTEMSSGQFNEQGVTRHTPYADQRLRLVTDFVRALESASYWNAFNEEYVKLAGFTKMNFWQSIQKGSRMNININRASDGEAKEVNNVLAVLNDRWACGTYRQYRRVATTPINAAGLYYNTYWHEKQLWFNDLSENAVIFTLS